LRFRGLFFRELGAQGRFQKGLAMTSLTVDFILREADLEKAPGKDRNRPCPCGSERAALVSEMKADSIKGMPASRMYECLDCGEYRLG
jgi:hypothetical protein